MTEVLTQIRTTDSKQSNFLGGFIALLSLAFFVKLFLIHYGLPFSTHVDESDILKDPFRILFSYTQGDFSRSTNLFNWVLLAWFLLVFVIGFVFGQWTSVEQFKAFLVSGSPDVILFGRYLPMLLSLLAIFYMIKLICLITTQRKLRWLFGLIVVLNPLEINAVNWLKFDAASVLCSAIIILVGHQYFVLRQHDKRKLLYLITILAVTVRIDMIAYFVGFLFYDLLFFSRSKKFGENVRELSKPVVAGIVGYLVITLMPLSWYYSKFVASSAAPTLVTSPTFQEAIVTKIPGAANILDAIINSGIYAECVFALLGPVVIVLFAMMLRRRIYWFVVLPFIIFLFVLLIFPVKNTHYLANVSLILIYGAFITATELTTPRLRIALSLITILWAGSFTINQLFVLARWGDVRVDARQYVLQRTKPDDVIYVDGIFAHIYDKTYRHALRSEAAKVYGSTGLSSDHLSKTLNDKETRIIKQVSAWEPFAGTTYENIFNNFYDTALLAKDNPSFYIYVAPSINQVDFRDNPHFQKYQQFYEYLSVRYVVASEFLYETADPRLKYSNYYYFHPVLVYRSTSLR